MAGEAGIAAPVSAYGSSSLSLILLQLRVCVRWWHMGSNWLSVDMSTEKILLWYFSLSRYFPINNNRATKANNLLKLYLLSSPFSGFLGYVDQSK